MIEEETIFMEDDYDQDVFLDVCSALQEPDVETSLPDE